MRNIQVEIPEINSELDQDEEFFILKDGRDRKILFHDYRSIYKIPGLYEEVFHNQLECKSPGVIANLLFENVNQAGEDFGNLNILDFGAGNGLVGKALSKFHPNSIVGVDIIQEAKEAALRDRKGIYKDYKICDFARMGVSEVEAFSKFKFNAFVSVAALGFGHIPPKGFTNAFNLVEAGGWVAINLRDRFLTDKDESGFGDMIHFLKDRYIDIREEKTYRHRLSVSGEPIHYTAIVGKKLGDMEGS